MNNKTKTKKINKSGVNKLNCGSCLKVYVFLTGTSLKKSVAEHKNSFIKGKMELCRELSYIIFLLRGLKPLVNDKTFYSAFYVHIQLPNWH